MPSRRELDFTSPEGKSYALDEETATLVVRPRGWHLVERHVTVDGEPVSASLFDFGLYLFHDGRAALERGAGPCLGPYFYLPKLESHLEARLWNDAFVFGQEALGIPRGTIRATVLVETIWAAFEMDEILHELREHAAGLNAGRWDYIFSLIKAFRERPDMVLPDRAQVTMAVPFMRAYTQLLVRDLPSARRARHRRHERVHPQPARAGGDRERALARVREDKEREAGDGFDGTWVAHPDLVPGRPRGLRPRRWATGRTSGTGCARTPSVTAAQLLDADRPGGHVTEAGVRANISVGAPVPRRVAGRQRRGGHQQPDGGRRDRRDRRSQLWQWRVTASAPTRATSWTCALLLRLQAEELDAAGRAATGAPGDAAELLDDLVLRDEFADFLTLGRTRASTDARLAARAARDPASPQPRPRATKRPWPRRPTKAPSTTTSSPRTMTRRTRPRTSCPRRA